MRCLSLGTCLQILSIIVTLIVAVIALFKDAILRVISPPKPVIDLVSTEGQIGTTPGLEGKNIQAVYFHLQVINLRPRKEALGCKITLNEFFLFKGNSWERTIIPVPPFFYWAPMEPDGTNGRTDIFSRRTFDFLIAREDKDHLAARVNRTFTEMNWQVYKDHPICYLLQIEGRNFNPVTALFEIKWSGVWPDPDRSVVRIRKVDFKSLT